MNPIDLDALEADANRDEGTDDLCFAWADTVRELIDEVRRLQEEVERLETVIRFWAIR